ncbi:hypothetical protein TELCIR_11068 [Teladorsagia circumcincta]|uniref:Reverse transcriptase domain-containing protein n=1 Tax=Teladorsagia circumcincta TaxID=45464 RepID=A0A2G9UAF4_TELCI|nr:hypothetical protein TELCIR_11068 [Teladorsagia circumcincta]
MIKRNGSQASSKWKPTKPVTESGRSHRKTMVKVCERQTGSKPRDATVVNRVYVSPEKGTTEVPVLNHTSQPIIFHEGQKIGVWEEVDTIQPAAKDLESDMLELHMGPESESDQINTLLNLLANNSKYGRLPGALTKLVTKFQDVFAISDKELTQTVLIKHSIDTGDTKAIKQKSRPVPLGVRSELKNTLNDFEEKNILRKSTPYWASPIVLVQKKDKTLRLCIDYRALNKHTKQDFYPTNHGYSPAKPGRKEDFQHIRYGPGYWQIKLTEDAQQKSAFTTPEGLHESLVLPFGLCTSPAVFQRLMDRVLRDLKGEEIRLYVSIQCVPSDELSPYRIDIDDYGASLMSDMKTIQDMVRKNNGNYRSKMKQRYDKLNETDISQASRVGDRVFVTSLWKKGRANTQG